MKRGGSMRHVFIVERLHQMPKESIVLISMENALLLRSE